jgi:septal ring factor EnvC (AmiA/AmiB activator)
MLPGCVYRTGKVLIVHHLHNRYSASLIPSRKEGHLNSIHKHSIFPGVQKLAEERRGLRRIWYKYLFKVIFLFLFILIFSTVSYSVPPQEEYKKIQKKMIEHEKKLKEARKLEYSVLNEIQEVNKKLREIEAKLRTLKKKLRETQSKTIAVSNEISKTKNILEKQKDWIKRKLTAMYKFGHSGDAIILFLSAEDISQVTRILKYLEVITRYEHKVLASYRENLKILDEKNNKLKALKTRLMVNKKRVKSKEKDLAVKKKAKILILSSARYKKASHEKMLSELKEASKKLLELIRESEKKDTYSTTSFSRTKGKLTWPASGKIALPYGTQKDPQFNTTVFRNGIHIQTNSSANVTSVHKGKVIFAEWFKGFGQLVIINHGSGYHTLYGNLSEIFSSVGDIIKGNQVVGKVGTSGILNAPGLYFEIRYKGKPLDPKQWLTKKGR